MPCVDPRIEMNVKVVQERLDLVTRLLCEVCGRLEDAGSPLLKLNDELDEWWTAHKELDKQRERKVEVR